MEPRHQRLFVQQLVYYLFLSRGAAGRCDADRLLLVDSAVQRVEDPYGSFLSRNADSDPQHVDSIVYDGEQAWYL
ncbi:hypothetical protein D3C71_2202950 [compost metagenome]